MLQERRSLLGSRSSNRGPIVGVVSALELIRVHTSREVIVFLAFEISFGKRRPCVSVGNDVSHPDLGPDSRQAGPHRIATSCRVPLSHNSVIDATRLKNRLLLRIIGRRGLQPDSRVVKSEGFQYPSDKLERSLRL
uniref:Uncharacterized protein n=1 Tax=Vespula pensylvanica TaxID=30213 RepID=A0A834NZH4_VESPE|nr:hypothetical protein H0235_009554 [Vespula pensylvanica]